MKAKLWIDFIRGKLLNAKNIHLQSTNAHNCCELHEKGKTKATKAYWKAFCEKSRKGKSQKEKVSAKKSFGWAWQSNV